MADPTDGARFVWFDESGEGRNRFAAFRYAFELRSASARAELNVFADTAYHLYVNGAFVAAGPARFDPLYPLYDTHDLAPYLRKGRNVIAVLARYYGDLTFLSRVARAGMVAWGAVRDGRRSLKIATPEGWKVRREEGYDPTAPNYSFTLPPLEVYDQARGLGRWTEPDYDDSAWADAVVITGDLPWGELSPRTVPLATYRDTLPERVVSVGRLSDDEALYSFRTRFFETRNPDAERHSKMLFACTELHAAREMDLTLGLFWGDHWLNGAELKNGRPSTRSRHRIDHDVHLNAGWNSLFVLIPAYGDCWDFYLALPHAAGVAVSADRDSHSSVLFRTTRPLLAEEYEQHIAPLGVPFGPEETAALPDLWRDWPRGRGAENPSRETDLTPAEPVDWPESAYKVAGLVFRKDEFLHGFAVTFDFGQDHMVRPTVSLAGVRGAQIDMAYGEQLRDGRVDLYALNPRIQAADRFRAAEDEVEWMTFEPRGLRYLTLTVRGAAGNVTLRSLKGVSSNAPLRADARFACSDPVLTKVWDLCKRSVQTCMEDVFSADAYRERGMYGRDTDIMYMTNLACFGDQALMRRSLELFIQTMTEDGLILACAPLDWDYYLYDFGMNDVAAFYQYYRHSGDRAFAERAWQPAVRAIDGMRIFMHPCGLLSADRENMKVKHRVMGYGINHSDNGASKDHHDKEGVSCNFNATWVGAMRAAAGLCRAAGEEGQAAKLEAEADRISERIRELLWDPARDLYADNLQMAHHSVQGNALAVLYGVATPQQLPSIREFLAAELEDNFYAKTDPTGGARMSPGYAYYVLEGVCKAGLPGTLEKVIRRCWGWMLGDGATTTYEFWRPDAGPGNCSRCIPWSSSPAWFLSREVLGVSFPEPGNVDVVCVEPHAESVTWAEGSYPHPRGSIDVRWQRRNGRMELEVRAPRGVRVVGTAARVR